MHSAVFPNLFCSSEQDCVKFGDFGKWQPFLHPYGCKRTCLKCQNTNDLLQLNPALNSSALSAFQVWLNSDNSLFSSVLESTVSNRQVLLIGHACLALSALVCAVSLSVEAATFLFIWFFEAVFLCVKGGLK